MACRYLEQLGAQGRRCQASDPEREPTRTEVDRLCMQDPQPCPYHRFRRAAGRSLKLEDHAAWDKQRAEEAARRRAVIERGGMPPHVRPDPQIVLTPLAAFPSGRDPSLH